jgi:hypothetical protein
MLDPLPIISDLSGEDISLLYLGLVYNGLPPADAQKIVNAIVFIRDLIDDIAALPAGSAIIIPFGDFTLGGFDPRGQSDSKSATITTSSDKASLDAAFAGQSGQEADIANSLRDNSGQTTIIVPILQDPMLAFELLMGRDISLVEVELPAIDIEFNYKQSFPIFGPLSGTVRADFELYVGATFGYDTTGYRKYQRTGRITDTLDGFYIVADPNRPNVRLNGEVSVGASFDGGIVEAGVSGGVGATIEMYLSDPNEDGKLRAKELDMILRYDPLCLFEARGEVYARLYAWYEYFFGLGGDEIDIVPPITIVEFTHECDREPRLADDVGADGVLRLNAGPTAEDRLWGNTDDGDETYLIEDLGGGSMKVTFTDEDGFEQQQIFSGVTSIFFDGGVGNDVLDARGVSVPVIAYGRAGNDTLIGGGLADQLDGGEGDSTIDGGGGDDTITVSAGAHKIVGGAGTDRLKIAGNNNYQFSQTGFAVGDAAGVWKVTGGPLDPVEELDLVGGIDGNKFDLTGWKGEAKIDGVEGADTVIAADNVDYTITDTTLERTGVPTIQMVSIEKTKLTGGSSANSFTVSGWKGSGVINGGGGMDTLNAVNDVDFFLTDTSLDRTNRQSLSLVSIETANLTGGAARNYFLITDWTGNGSLDGEGGKDTVAEVNDFHYIITDSLLFRTGGGDMALAEIENTELTGGDSSNAFDVSGWSGTGVISGDDGWDAIVATNNENFTLTDGTLDRTGRGRLVLNGQEAAILAGGVGNNTFDVTGWHGTGLLNGDGGADTVVSAGDEDFFLTREGLERSSGGRLGVINVEHADLTAGAGVNTLHIDRWQGTGSYNGGAGYDAILVTEDTNYALSDSLLQRGGRGNFALGGVEQSNLVGGSANNGVDLTGWTGTGSVRGNAGTDTVFAGGDQNYTLADNAYGTSSGAHLDLDSIEQAALAGGAGNNAFTLSGWTGNAQISGEGGTDALIVGRDTDFHLTSGGLTTEDGADVDTSNVELAYLTGGTGSNDFVVDGWQGTAVIAGGAGQDTVAGTFNGDVSLSDAELDADQLGAGPKLIIGGVERAVINGTPGDQTFDLSGWSGTGAVYGGGGKDTIVSAGDGDFRLSDAGLSLPTGGYVNLSGIGNAVLTGGRGNNTFDLTGWRGTVTVTGDLGRDTVIAADNTDFALGESTLISGRGLNATLSGVENVILSGGLGDNGFELTGWNREVTVIGNGGTDTVYLGNAHLVSLSDNSLTTDAGLRGSLFGITRAVVSGTPTADAFDLTGWTGRADLFGGFGSTTDPNDAADVIVFAGDYDYTLTTQLLAVTNGARLFLTGIELAVLTGGNAANTFDVSGWNSRVTLIGGAGSDTVVSAGPGNATLTDANLSRTTGLFAALFGVEAARIIGDAAANRFDVSDWTGSAELDGAGGSDEYDVVFHGTGSGSTAITDSGMTGTDVLTVSSVVGTPVRVDPRVTLPEDDEWVEFAGVELIEVA